MRRASTSKTTIQALSTFVKLMRASESVLSDVHQASPAGNLTVSQFGVLEALYHLGPMVQKDLAAKILKTAGNMTLVIDNLEKQQLVERHKCEKDRRRTYIKLTKNGENLICQIFPHHAEAIEQRLAMLSSDEKVQLNKLLKRISLEKEE